MTARWSIHTSRTTIPHRIIALPTEPVGKISQLGIDDVAFRQGHQYGTIFIEIVSQKVVDLLVVRGGFPHASSAILTHFERKSLIMPDRTVETPAVWMGLHPEITLISRDRGGDYAAAVRTGAPQATQVADIFHLAKNLAEIGSPGSNPPRNPPGDPV